MFGKINKNNWYKQIKGWKFFHPFVNYIDFYLYFSILLPHRGFHRIS